MKRTFFSILAALFLAPLGAVAQIYSDEQPFAAPASTEATHSVSLDIPMGANLHYAYELPIARRATVIGRIGAYASVVWGYNMFFGNYSYWSIFPSIDIEPRFYYGLDRREAHGRNTEGNAGSFIALNIKNILPFGYISDPGIGFSGATVFTPQWGLRRVWGGHWLFEFTTGINLAVGWKGGTEWSPSLLVRFGYSF